VTENGLLDTKHITLVHNLFKELFNKDSTIYIHKHNKVIRSKIYSKSIQKFLVNRFNLTIGKKLNSPNRIPQEFYKENKYLIACIRGIFDTDGTFCRHRLKDPMIEIDCCNTNLRDSVLDALKLLKLRVSYSGKKYTFIQKMI
jgi:intein/homing endonuclease